MSVTVKYLVLFLEGQITEYEDFIKTNYVANLIAKSQTSWSGATITVGQVTYATLCKYLYVSCYYIILHFVKVKEQVHILNHSIN